ncbi:fatty acyl-CoA reductase wat-like [Drosophila nasuta]|uniref:fatty acyl-CoA reductase wat-like n=1 Tax=Drosophila nasuta TaxID=42062 RepID=UPI00295EFA0F|nr:fatty acyl-CoA reductase wat-like [Drosophila nasuta]
MESQITEFFKDKTVLITGGTGFLGRVTIEKLLRSTDVAKVYVLMRPKRGKSIKERFESWRTNSLFGVLLKTKPNALDRIVSISGDCEEPDLGISLAEREILRKEVQVVIHCAATVNFVEPLHKALDINARATRLMLELAREMNNLMVFVHVSTAFSNCVIHHITEHFYPGHLNCTVDKVLAVRELCDNTVIDEMTSALLGKFPNTYTYTKALAEQLIQTESRQLPVCIYRPGAIMATSRNPMPGWIDNIYGPVATIYGATLGVLRVAPVNLDANCDIVPVDFCANLILACAWQTAREFSECEADQSPPKIYNHVPHAKNMITNRSLINATERLRLICPLEQSIWYPFLHTTTTIWLLKLAYIFYHLLPGYIMDLALRFRGQKPRMIKLYNRIHEAIDATCYFSSQSWSFETHNTDQLWQSLLIADKENYEFDMQHLNWDKFFERVLTGMRLYLGKEEPTEESKQRGLKHMKRLTLYHRILQFVLCCGAAFIVKWFICLFL